MFWKTKKVVVEERKTEVLDIHYVFGSGKKSIKSITYFESESNDNMYLFIKAIEQASLEQRRTDKKLDLILDHLKLKYVPETETKETAKLVEKTTVGSLTSEFFGCPMYVSDTPPTKPKKKRGRPKKK